MQVLVVLRTAQYSTVQCCRSNSSVCIHLIKEDGWLQDPCWGLVHLKMDSIFERLSSDSSFFPFVPFLLVENVEVVDGKVTVCRDAVKGKCTRPNCKYYHPSSSSSSSGAASSKTSRQNLLGPVWWDRGEILEKSYFWYQEILLLVECQNLF